MGRFSEANAPVAEADTFPTPHPQPRPFSSSSSSSSSVLYSSSSTSHIKGQPTSTLAVLPLESRSKTSTLSVFNGREDFLRPGTSTSSMLQGTTPIQRMPQTTLSRAYEQQAQRETYAFPRDAPVASPASPAHGVNASQYWNHGVGISQNPINPQTRSA
jgi:hypothetical protein